MQFYRRTVDTFTPLLSSALFLFLLTFVFILYQPDHGPGRFTQRIGWQAWANIDLSSSQLAIPSQSSGSSKPSVSNPISKPSDPDVDWWDVGKQQDDTPASSLNLPLDRWDPLLPHDTGLTELAISRCVIPPSLTRVCNPASTPEDEALKGPWVRVDRDLNKRDGLWFLNIYYRRTRRLDIPLVTNITLLSRDEEPPSDRDHWHKVDLSIRDGVMGSPQLFLWYRLGPPLRDLSADQKKELITELDVLYGIDKPWFGFEKHPVAVFPGKEGRTDPVWLTYRRGVKPVPKAPPLHFNRNGTFKILQVADLHFSTDPGHCRDTDLTPCRQGDYETKKLISRILDEEKPDLVVFSGDQLNGQGTAWDSRSIIIKFTAEVIDRKIPWAAVFGNHDDEDDDLNRSEQMKFLSALPYSLCETGPKDVDGVGNYVLKVKSPDASKTNLLTLYLLDSHAYTERRLPGLFSFLEKLDYDWIKPSQIDWFLAESASIKPIIRPFTPDGAKDLGPISRRTVSRAEQGDRLAKPPAIMFFHIPLQEVYFVPDKHPKTGKPLQVGSELDGPGASKTNGGFFERALMKAKAVDDDKDKELEVKVVANGHSHISDDCMRLKGIWMCFDGGSSYSGYGKVGFDRRFRVFEISQFGEVIRTYKRTERNSIIDDMIVAGPGAMGETTLEYVAHSSFML